MKRRHLFPALFGAIVIGYLAGFATPRAANHGGDANVSNRDQQDGDPRFRKGDRPVAESDHSSVSRLRQDIRKLPPEKLPALVYRALELGDPIVRQQLLADLFTRMDSENFRAMTDELDRISLETGRDHYDEWLLIHARAGQVAGAAAMEKWNTDLERGSEQSCRSLWGWASTDPAAAKEWLDQLGDIQPNQRAKLLNALTTGAIVRDPDQAIQLFGSLPDEDRLRNVKSFTWNLVQSTGKDGAIAWLQSVKASEGPDSIFAKAVSDQVFDKLIWSGANQSKPAIIAADLERLAAVVPIDESHINRALAQVRQSQPAALFDFLEKVTQNPALQTQQPFSETLGDDSIAYAVKRNPAAVAIWLQQHPNSPLHSRVNQAVLNPPAMAR